MHLCLNMFLLSQWCRRARFCLYRLPLCSGDGYSSSQGAAHTVSKLALEVVAVACRLWLCPTFPVQCRRWVGMRAGCTSTSASAHTEAAYLPTLQRISAR